MPNAPFSTGILFIKTRDQNGNDLVAYYQHNHLPAPLQAIDKQGNIRWAALYTAFGQTSIISSGDSAINSNLRLPGQYADSESGLYYNWQRYYDANTGRYISSDPIGLTGGFNRYAYVGGNPVGWVDPSGLRGSCPIPPRAPPGVNVDDNIKIAEEYSWYNPYSSGLFYNTVRNNGPWDYKRRGGKGQYESFGNFNFGATAAAMGYPYYVAQNGAGYYQQHHGAAKAGEGILAVQWPYGDDPKDAEEIKQGYDYYKNRCHCSE